MTGAVGVMACGLILAGVGLFRCRVIVDRAGVIGMVRVPVIGMILALVVVSVTVCSAVTVSGALTVGRTVTLSRAVAVSGAVTLDGTVAIGRSRIVGRTVMMRSAVTLGREFYMGLEGADALALHGGGRKLKLIPQTQPIQLGLQVV